MTRDRRGERFATPFGTRAWHPDGTPFSPNEYRAAGLEVPTPEQQALWARQDREREREPATWSEWFAAWGALPGTVRHPGDMPTYFVQRFTPGDPRGTRFRAVDAANAYVAVHEAARQLGDAGQGRVTRLPDRRGRGRMYARRLRSGRAVRYEVRIEE